MLSIDSIIKKENSRWIIFFAKISQKNSFDKIARRVRGTSGIHAMMNPPSWECLLGSY